VGVDQLFMLSTQSYTFFQSKAGFVEGSIDDLPKNRGELHVQSGRNSKILKKSLSGETRAGVRAE
jgi:N-acetylglutamate synthase-like GNAT family acetyltransferase